MKPMILAWRQVLLGNIYVGLHKVLNLTFECGRFLLRECRLGSFEYNLLLAMKLLTAVLQNVVGLITKAE